MKWYKTNSQEPKFLKSLPRWMVWFWCALWMEICTIHKNSFPMQSTIVANTFDGHISSCRNNSMVLAKDFVGHFRNGIFGKCRHYSVMLDCCWIQICFQGNENWCGFWLKFQTDLYFAVQKKIWNETNTFMLRLNSYEILKSQTYKRNKRWDKHSGKSMFVFFN